VVAAEAVCEVDAILVAVAGLEALADRLDGHVDSVPSPLRRV